VPEGTSLLPVAFKEYRIGPLAYIVEITVLEVLKVGSSTLVGHAFPSLSDHALGRVSMCQNTEQCHIPSKRGPRRS
jgi:hypothetical protein